MVARTLDKQRYKRADAEVSDEASFEQAFSSIAHSYLRNRAPGLLDHELGFQLVDASEDRKKAVGIMAFKVGPQTLYAPVFFLNGELKGKELLYISDQDLFVPLQENWLNYLIQRKPQMLGSGTSRQLHRKGVRQPELRRLSMSPTKYASESGGFMPVMCAMIKAGLDGAVGDLQEHCSERLDLEDFLKQASLPALRSLTAAISEDIEVARAFNDFDGLSLLRDALKTAEARMTTSSLLDAVSLVDRDRQHEDAVTRVNLLSKAAALDDVGVTHKNELEIITRQSVQPSAVDDMTEAEQSELAQDGILIRDARKGEELAVAVRVTGPQQLSNPHETGIYQVLTKPHGFRKCLVIVAPCGLNGNTNFSTVVAMEGEKNWVNISNSEVWVAGMDEGTPVKAIEGTRKAWNEWYDSLPEANSLTKGATCMLVTNNRAASVPFIVEKEVLPAGDMPRYDVQATESSFDRYDRKQMTVSYESEATSFESYNKYRDGERVTLKAIQGSKLRSSRGELFVPVGAKLLTLQDADAHEDGDDDKSHCCPMPAYASRTPALVPGNAADIEMLLTRKTAALSVRKRNDGYSINESQQLLSLPNALLHLTCDWKLHSKQARDILREADDSKRAGGRSFECRVKLAVSSLLDSAPSAPSPEMEQYSGDNMMGFNGPVMEHTERHMPVQGMQSRDYDRSGYDIRPDATPSPTDLSTVQQAAQTGQKEVFDVSMIGSMLKAVRDDTMVDRYISDLIKAVDRLGRIIFMFYWHQGKFSERYGKQDMPELEDGLRSTFESLGELVLLLRQKSVETFPEEGGQLFNPNPEEGL